jgi:hypothetical protein
VADLFSEGLAVARSRGVFLGRHMLSEILKTSSQPPPWWLASTFSTLLGAVVGFCLGLVGQWFGQWFLADRLGCRNMRRVLYRDLAQMFWAVDHYMNTDPSEMGAQCSDPLLWQQSQFRKFLSFQAEKYCLDNPAIYMQLPERFAGQTLYRWFHCILEEPVMALPLNTRWAVKVFTQYVHDGDVHNGGLKRKYFKKFLGKEKARDLLRKVDQHYRQDQEHMQRLKANLQKEGPSEEG